MIELLPYVPYGEQWIVNDEIIKKIWDKLVEQELHVTVFYQGDITTRDDFFHFMQAPTNLPVLVFVNKKLGGFAWLNAVSHSHAFGHFAFFKETWGRHTDEIGEKILDYWFSIPDKDNPIFETIIGAVPDFNHRAIKYAKRIGFIELGTIPKFAYLPYRGEKRGLTLLYKRSE